MRDIFWILLVVVWAQMSGAQTDETLRDKKTGELEPPREMVGGSIQNWPRAAEELKIDFKVEKFQLENGLTVLLHADNSVPIVSYHTWFRVGSRDETIGQTGLAHFLEHLMFKGTERYPNKEFDKILQANGITNNAFTAHDYTGYFEVLPSSKLELIIDIEADRLANLKVRDADFTSELEVVKEERRTRVDNNPVGMVWEAMFKTVFRVHPYGWPIIGWMKDLDSMKVEWVRDFYQKYYGPNNAVLVVAGDIDIDKTKLLIEKYYSKIPAIELPKKEIPAEPAQTGQRNSTLVKNVRSEKVMLSFAVPEAGTEGSYALDLAASVLGEGPSSRLYRRLVYKERLASSVASFNYTLKDKGLFVVMATPLPGKPIEEIKRAIFSELWKLRNTPIEASELRKAKNMVMTGYVNGLTTIDSKARALATNEILFSDYSVIFKDLGRYQNVSIESVQSLSEQFLNPHQRSVIVLEKRR